MLSGNETGWLLGDYLLSNLAPDEGKKTAGSGVVTFIVSHSGIVYEKDLGENTAAVAKSMTSFDPDKSWRKVEQAAP